LPFHFSIYPSTLQFIQCQSALNLFGVKMAATATVQATAQKPQYARAKHAAAYFKISKATLWAWAKRPGFPKPKKASARVTLFDLAAIDRFIESQQAR
jgi:predicted DNA-binding transcriptional regulator AlpA